MQAICRPARNPSRLLTPGSRLWSCCSLLARQSSAQRSTMKQLFLLVVSAALLSGCVSHKSCHVDFAPDHTDVKLSLDVYGLVFGPCTVTTHGGYDYTFRMPGQKPRYLGDEIREVPEDPHWTPYEGSISIERDRRRVLVKLSRPGYDQKDYPFELNGTYHYAK